MNDNYTWGTERDRRSSSSNYTINSIAEEDRVISPRRTAVAAEPTRLEEAFCEIKVHQKPQKAKDFLTSVLKQSVLFRGLDEESQESVVMAMVPRTSKPNEVVIKQGDDGDFFYIIEKGQFDALINNIKVKSYNNAGYFGELALLYNTPRAATVISQNEGTLWALDRNTFRAIVVRNAHAKRDEYSKLINSVDLLKSLSADERMKVCDTLTTQEYKDGEVIIQQGEPGKEMYFVESGEVRIELDNKGKKVELKRLKTSEYFGELALHSKKPRAASAYAVGNTRLAVLSIESFERLLGPCLPIIQRNKERYNEVIAKLSKSAL